jgi:hypothetical protein
MGHSNMPHSYAQFAHYPGQRDVVKSSYIKRRLVQAHEQLPSLLRLLLRLHRCFHAPELFLLHVLFLCLPLRRRYRCFDITYRPHDAQRFNGL